MMETVRCVSRNLSPASLDLGINSALESLFDEFAGHHETVQFSVEIDKIVDLFCTEDRINIYRIFQEALTNIGKYAQANLISVIVKKEKEKVSFLIEDNGRGFDVHQVSTADIANKGIGLNSIQERVRMLGSELQIWSEKDKGTRIFFKIPLTNKQLNPAINNRPLNRIIKVFKHCVN